MRGKAEVTLISPCEALYCESARVELATGEVLSGKQNYLYRHREFGFDILFADTELLFQSLQFRYDGCNLAATAAHNCLHDHYFSEYFLYSANLFFVQHMVRGPAKHYTSVTAFQRVS